MEMEETRKQKLWLISINQSGLWKSGRVSDCHASKGVGPGWAGDFCQISATLGSFDLERLVFGCFSMFLALVLLLTLSGDLNCSRQCLREGVWTKDK